MLSLREAKHLVFDHFFKHSFSAKKKEVVVSTEAVGRILSTPVSATISSPHFNSAAMDGVAVIAENTFGACEAKPQELVISEEAEYINTGQVVPEKFNAVIMIEHVEVLSKNKVRIENPVFPWQNVRKIGEDIIATELIYPRNHKITPYCIGALISAGVYEVCVRKKPKIIIIPTGSELVDWSESKAVDLKPGQVLETNSYVLSKMIEACGGICVRHKTILDDINAIELTVTKAIENDFDIILTIGGSSSGSKDYILPIANKLGKILVHGVTMMPGKPIIVSDINSKPFFGIPGYPVSAIMAFEQFVRPMISHMLCVPDNEREMADVMLSHKVVSKLGMEEFLRVKIGKVRNKLVATPLPRGSGTITSLTEADGIVRIDEETEGINTDNVVKAELFKSFKTITNTVMVVGSHDNSLNVLADELKRINTKMTLSSSNVGSIGGLIAIKKGMCHISGLHLLDAKTGNYNIPYVKKYLPDDNIKLVNLVMRVQGIMIPKENPKNIIGIEDFIRDDITFINRQKGSGTRILLDYKLSELGIPAKNIKGYFREEFTHMEVAMAIANGSADATLGIYAASKALDLSFIPIVKEQYDLAIHEEIFYSKNIQTILKTIKSKSFKNRVNALGGYDTKNTGKIII
jgi:putative molybdopterin biosynthesis protein